MTRQSMDTITVRQASKLKYVGPRKALLASTIHYVMSQHPALPKRVQNWRTSKLQSELHMRQAALFCFGRKCAEVADNWAVAAWPEQDSSIDFVLRQTKPDREPRFEFVQLKEFVPDDVNPHQTLQALLDELPQKYPSTGGLTVAIHLHRNTTTNINELKKPCLPGGSLWFFGFGGKPPHNAFVFGDWLSQALVINFTYPQFRQGESVTH